VKSRWRRQAEVVARGRAAGEGSAATWVCTLNGEVMVGREEAVVGGGAAQRGWCQGGVERGHAREWNGHGEREERREREKRGHGFEFLLHLLVNRQIRADRSMYAQPRIISLYSSIPMNFKKTR
jgi:hypothetical protein